MTKKTLATVWLDGCSGCHMSFLDMDERLVEIIERADILYSPLVDFKEYPEWVDIALVEGAVATDHDRSKILKIRRQTGTLVSLGDCAVTANVPGMRNYFKVQDVLDRAYMENATLNRHHPEESLPVLEKRVCPVHEVVQVDVFVPGCPPSADTIYFVLTELLEGRKPEVSVLTRFGS
jgi:NAD-reducing hydrogenase small subunit